MLFKVIFAFAAHRDRTEKLQYYHKNFAYLCSIKSKIYTQKSVQNRQLKEINFNPRMLRGRHPTHAARTTPHAFHMNDTHACHTNDTHACHTNDTHACRTNDAHTCHTKDTHACHTNDAHACCTNDTHACRTISSPHTLPRATLQPAPQLFRAYAENTPHCCTKSIISLYKKKHCRIFFIRQCLF